MISHPFTPPHMTRTSRGNVKGCCSKPAEDHLPFPDGEAVLLRLTKDVRPLNGRRYPKGFPLEGTRSNRSDWMQEVRPDRWGTNGLGQLAQLDKGEYAMVAVPGWTVRFPGDVHLTSLPLRWAREV